MNFAGLKSPAIVSVHVFTISEIIFVSFCCFSHSLFFSFFLLFIRSFSRLLHFKSKSVQFRLRLYPFSALRRLSQLRLFYFFNCFVCCNFFVLLHWMILFVFFFRLAGDSLPIFFFYFRLRFLAQKSLHFEICRNVKRTPACVSYWNRVRVRAYRR